MTRVAPPQTSKAGAPAVTKALDDADSEAARREREKFNWHIQAWMYLQLAISFFMVALVAYAVAFREQDLFRIQAVLIALSIQTTVQFVQCLKISMQHYYPSKS